MIEVTATVRNQAGIHCRPSAVIVKTVAPYAGVVKVRTDEGEADCRSIMGLLSLAMEQGTRIRIRVDGPDESLLSTKLVELFETHFDFPPTA